MIPMRVLEEFAAQIAGCYAPERIILFGSQARGDAKPDSDADILIIMPFDGSGLRKSVEILVRLSPKFPIDLITRRPEDVRRSYAEGDPLIGEALEEGVVLYERDGEGVAAHGPASPPALRHALRLPDSVIFPLLPARHEHPQGGTFISFSCR